jgi:hypothetical protein
MELTKKGLNSFQIKLIALVLMTFDHIHYMFSGVVNVPMWLTMLGRISAPLFIFMVANGMAYTSNRKKYLLRLYIGFVAMNILNSIASKYTPHPAGNQLIANIFSSLFLICFFICMANKIKESVKNHSLVRAIGYTVLLLVPVFVGVAILMMISGENPSMLRFLLPLMWFVPTPILAEGGIMFIILGLGFYIFRKRKVNLSIFYLIYCGYIFYMSAGGVFTVDSLFHTNVQWMMIFALPIIQMYNNQKGKSMKYFFYLYYPAHMYLLLWLSILVYHFI